MGFIADEKSDDDVEDKMMVDGMEHRSFRINNEEGERS